MREGTCGFWSTISGTWSASSRAGVAAMTFCISSTVASGPMPPRIPTRRIGSGRPFRDHPVIAEQRRRSAGVQEDDALPLGEAALAAGSISPAAALPE
jgi:hypothetical protein